MFVECFPPNRDAINDQSIESVVRPSVRPSVSASREAIDRHRHPDRRQNRPKPRRWQGRVDTAASERESSFCYSKTMLFGEDHRFTVVKLHILQAPESFPHINAHTLFLRSVCFSRESSFYYSKTMILEEKSSKIESGGTPGALRAQNFTKN